MRTYLRGVPGPFFHLGLKITIGLLLYAIAIATSEAANPCVVYLSRVNKSSTIELTATRDGATAGKLLYCRDDGECYVNAIYVEPSARRTGVSTDLIRHMLAREPETSSIAAVLVMDNYYATGLVSLARDATEEECREAVKKSPLYKTAARFGFVNIVDCTHSVRTDMISVVFSL